MTIRRSWIPIVILVGMTCLADSSTMAKDSPHDFSAVGSPVEAAAADPAIAQALAQISARHVQDTIETLVAFGTRHTLSSMIADLPKGQGATAAADWIESEFKRYSD